jgi:hypothetical protein
MKFFQNHYWYLLVVGLLSYFVSYICFRRVVSLLLRWSSVGLCSQHGQPGTKEEQADVRQQSDRGDKSECENCIQKTGQLVAEVSEKCVGILHAANCTVMSYLIIRETEHDVMNAKSPLLIPFVQFSVTYFVYDLVAMYISFASREGNKGIPLSGKIWKYFKRRHAFIIHHIILVGLGYPLAVHYSIRNGTGDFFIACFCIGEFTNHFISGSHILRLLGYQKSVIFKVNAVLLVLSFLLSRILILPYMYAQYFKQEATPWMESLQRMPRICHIGMTLIAVFQVFWAITIIRTGLKITKMKKIKQT